MEYYEATITGGNGSRPDAVAVVILQADSLADAADTIERLIAHGHSVSGMCHGVSADDCADTIEGYDKASERADAAKIYPVFDYEDEPEDDLQLIAVRRSTLAAYAMPRVNAKPMPRPMTPAELVANIPPGVWSEIHGNLSDLRELYQADGNVTDGVEELTRLINVIELFNGAEVARLCLDCGGAGNNCPTCRDAGTLPNP